MIKKEDIDYYNHIAPMLSDRRKDLFDDVLKQRTRHFTVILEDLFQKHF